VTVVLPRRSYTSLLGRFLHDRTADKIAAVVSRIPDSAATIIPFDVRARIEQLHERQVAKAGEKAALTAELGDSKGVAAAAGPAEPAGLPTPVPTAAAGAPAGSSADGSPPARQGPDGSPPAASGRGWLRNRLARARRGGPGRPAGEGKPSYERPTPPPGVNPIGSIQVPGRATVEGRVRSVEIRPVEKSSVLAIEIADSTGYLTALFYGRSNIPGVICGTKVRFRGPVGLRAYGPVMINPAYELLAPGTGPDGAETP
jgi:hypothetical protein